MRFFFLVTLFLPLLLECSAETVLNVFPFLSQNGKNLIFDEIYNTIYTEPIKFCTLFQSKTVKKNYTFWTANVYFACTGKYTPLTQPEKSLL